MSSSEFKLNIEFKLTMVKNPQVCSIVECLHGELDNIFCTSILEARYDLDPMDIEQYIIDAA